MKLSIIITCFNEESTIQKVIEEAKQVNLDKEIIVIDNCSTDGTREILESHRSDNSLRIIIHSKNLGAGYSIREGIDLAKGDYFFGPGADLEYKMNDVYEMVKKLENENFDAVFGSRLSHSAYCSLNKYSLIKERPYWLGTIIATFLINLFYSRKLTDIIATKLIKISVLRKLNCRICNEASEFELVSRLCKKGYKIGEVPVFYQPRTHKEGKTIKAIHMIPALIAIFKIKFFEDK
ncbi:MAG: glycosyltransferase family 2 protein [Candidatus Omnitrophota bacterium]